MYDSMNTRLGCCGGEKIEIAVSIYTILYYLLSARMYQPGKTRDCTSGGGASHYFECSIAT